MREKEIRLVLVVMKNKYSVYKLTFCKRIFKDEKSTFFIGAFSLVVFSGISKKLHQTAVSDVMTENVEALARDETSSGYAEVSCVYEDVVNSDSLVVKVHSRSCSGEGDLACSCDHMK